MAEPDDTAAVRTCAWCSVVATDDETHCRDCGAMLAQRESLGDVRIVGLTDVDPALEAYDAQPMHIRGPSPSQGLASGAIVAAAAGGPAGLIAIGGFAAVAAVEYLGSRRPGDGPADLESVGQPSELALLALEKVRRDGDLAARGVAAGNVDTTDLDAGAAAASGTEATPPATGGEWRDLPA
jgi:hypothetical protein